MSKILVIATGKKTRGGITSVINLHRKMDYWNAWNCSWIETHIDKSFMHKVFYFFKSFLNFLVLLPFCQLVHVHMSEPSSAKRKYAFIMLAKLLKKRIVIHFHSFSPDTTIKGPYQNLYIKLFASADSVILLSDRWRKIFIESNIIDSSKIEVIHNPCQIRLPNSTPSDEVNITKNILFAGTLNQRKGYADLIEAFGRIASKVQDWRVIFAGNGEIDVAKMIGEKFNVSDQLVFLGWINGKDKYRVFSEADIFCLPSYAEGLPMALLDAISFGLPIITTPVGGILDIVQNEVNALIFEPGNINELEKNLITLMANRDLRQELGKNSLEIAKNRFDPQTIGNQMDKLYRELLK